MKRLLVGLNVKKLPIVCQQAGCTVLEFPENPGDSMARLERCRRKERDQALVDKFEQRRVPTLEQLESNRRPQAKCSVRILMRLGQ